MNEIAKFRALVEEKVWDDPWYKEHAVGWACYCCWGQHGEALGDHPDDIGEGHRDDCWWVRARAALSVPMGGVPGG